MTLVAWLIGLFVLSVAVLILAFTVFFHTTRWHLPSWLRALLVTIVIFSYAIWLLSDSDAFWPYRLGALGAALATYRFSRGFAKTFLPSFFEAFASARNKNRS